MTVMIFIFVFWLVSGFIASDTHRVTFLLTWSTFICNFFSHAAKEPEQEAGGQPPGTSFMISSRSSVASLSASRIMS